MAMKQPTVEDVFPIENGGIFQCHVSFQGCKYFFGFRSKTNLTEKDEAGIILFLNLVLIYCFHLGCWLLEGNISKMFSFFALQTIDSSFGFSHGRIQVHKFSQLSVWSQTSFSEVFFWIHHGLIQGVKVIFLAEIDSKPRRKCLDV